MKTTILCVLATVLCLWFPVAGQEESEDQAQQFFSEKFIAGFKVKLSDNFSAGVAGGIFYGTQFTTNRFRADPWEYQGFDIIPGFEAGALTVFDRLKISFLGDLYYSVRLLSNDGERDITQLRFRSGVSFVAPFAAGFTLQVLERYERILEKKVGVSEFDEVMRTDYFRLRSLLKLAAPDLTPLKISPYALYEGFIVPIWGGFYYFETEYGLRLSPVKGLSVTLAYQTGMVPELETNITHVPSLYVFYTIDVSESFPAWLRSVSNRNAGSD